MIPYATFDGDTGYVVFNWDISQYNDGKGTYRIEAFIGGDPVYGIPTGKYTTVKVKKSKNTNEIEENVEEIENIESVGSATSEPVGEVIDEGVVVIQGEVVKRHFSLVSILRRLFGI
jgi:hypothetical protein